MSKIFILNRNKACVTNINLFPGLSNPYLVQKQQKQLGPNFHC